MLSSEVRTGTAGFILAYCRGEKRQVPDDFIRVLREEQMQRLRLHWMRNYSRTVEMIWKSSLRLPQNSWLPSATLATNCWPSLRVTATDHTFWKTAIRHSRIVLVPSRTPRDQSQTCLPEANRQTSSFRVCNLSFSNGLC